MVWISWGTGWGGGWGGVARGGYIRIHTGGIDSLWILLKKGLRTPWDLRSIVERTQLCGSMFVLPTGGGRTIPLPCCKRQDLASANHEKEEKGLGESASFWGTKCWKGCKHIQNPIFFWNHFLIEKMLNCHTAILILWKTPDGNRRDGMFLGLVRQRPKNVCSASNDYGENREKKTQPPPQKKTANPEISLFQVVFGFGFVPKIITVCVPSRSAEIFPETYMFGTQWIIFWFVWHIFLERPFFLGSGGSRLLR